MELSSILDSSFSFPPREAGKLANVSAGHHEFDTSAWFIQTGLWIVLLVSAMLLPFLPGRHDPFAVTLSVAATGVAFGGLLLVPIGGRLALVRPRIRACQGGCGRRHPRGRRDRCDDRGGRESGCGGDLPGGVRSLAGSSLESSQNCAIEWRDAPALGGGGPDCRATGGDGGACGDRRSRRSMEPRAGDRELSGDHQRHRTLPRAYRRVSCSPSAHSGPTITRASSASSAIATSRAGRRTTSTSSTRQRISPRMRSSCTTPAANRTSRATLLDLLQLSPEDIRRQRGYFRSEPLAQANWKRFLFD